MIGLLTLLILIGVVAYVGLGARPLIGSQASALVVEETDRKIDPRFTVYCPSTVLREGRYFDCDVSYEASGNTMGTVRVTLENGKPSVGKFVGIGESAEETPSPRRTYAAPPPDSTPTPIAPVPETEDPIRELSDAEAQVMLLFQNMRQPEVSCQMTLRNPAGVWDLIGADVQADPRYPDVTESALRRYLTPLCSEFLDNLYGQ